VGPLVAYLTCALIWGSNWYATRICLQGFPPVAAAAARFLLAAVLLGAAWALFGRKGSPPTRRELGWFVLAGLLNGAQYGLINLAEVHIPGGLAAVIYGTYQLVTALFTVVTGTERVSWRSIAGTPLALAGLAIIYWDRMNLAGSQATGVLLMFGAVAAAAAYSTIIKRHGGRVSPLVSTPIFLAVTAIALGTATGVVERDALAWPAAIEPTLALVYLAVFGSAVAFVAFFYLIRKVSLVMAASLTFTYPVVALIVDELAKEPLRLAGRVYLGVVLTLAGLVMGFVIRPRPAAVTAVAAAARPA
jgi:drug/metabolite transporter (DMT)-like permease